MNVNYLLAGTLAYLVPSFIIAAPWHLKIFAGYYQKLEIYREGIIMPFGIMALTIQGVIYAVMYAALFADGPALINGLKFAVFAGLLGFSYTVLPVAAKHPMTSVSGFIKIETAFNAVQFLAVGPAIALAYAFFGAG